MDHFHSVRNRRLIFQRPNASRDVDGAVDSTSFVDPTAEALNALTLAAIFARMRWGDEFDAVLLDDNSLNVAADRQIQIEATQ